MDQLTRAEAAAQRRAERMADPRGQAFLIRYHAKEREADDKARGQGDKTES